ncbi:MAG: UTP-glucose-phosphate uridylyltransferase [Bacillales bacterium]|nr:UTP-glucose-phosphate uridylyltransferase [Bacillales bacterium]
MLGDDIVENDKPCLEQMIEMYDQYKTTILGVQEIPREDVNKYGIVNANFIEDRIYKVKGLVEKPSIEEAPSNLAILGRYIISPAIFEILEHTQPGKGGEIQLTDALMGLAQKEAMYAYNFEGRRYDVGDKQGFLEATVEYALRNDDLRDDFLKYLVKIVEKEATHIKV